MIRRVAIVAILATLAVVYVYRNVVEVVPWLPRNAGDFGQFHRAARGVLEGRAPDPTDYPYPPLPALLTIPLAPLEPASARFAWFVLGHIALFGSALLVWRGLGGTGGAAIAVAGVWALAGTAQENLALGQLNPIVLLFLSAAFALVRTSPRAAALAAGVAAALKLWPALCIAAVKRRAIPWGLAAAAALLVIPSLVFMIVLDQQGGAAPRYWMGTPASLNMSLPALALRFTYPVVPGQQPQWPVATHATFALEPWRGAISVAVAAMTLVAGLLMLRVWRDDTDRQLLLCGIIAVATLASPIAWYHYQIMQFPLFALLLVRFANTRRYLALAAVALLSLVITRREVRDLLWGDGTVERVLATGVFFAACNLVLILWIAIELRRTAEVPA